jgi:hypothetical protein
MKRILDPTLAVLACSFALALAWDVGCRAWSFESLLAVAAGLAAALLLSLATLGSGMLRMTAIALLFFTAVDLFYIASDELGAALLLVGTPVLALAHRRVPRAFFVASALVFLAGLALRPLEPWRLVQPGAPAPRPAAATHIVVHWVLDEMGSFDAVPPQYRVQADVDALTAAYRERGFTLLAGRPSSSEMTAFSLSRLAETRPLPSGTENLYQGYLNPVMKRNRLAETIAAYGWQVDITQSSYLDFCRSQGFRCTTWDLRNDASAFGDAGMGWGARAGMLQRSLQLQLTANGQRTAAVIAALQTWTPGLFRATPGEVGVTTLSLTALRMLDAQVARVTRLSGRQYVFAHILLPHHPWILDRDCSVLPVQRWVDPSGKRESTDPVVREASHQAYGRQQVCAHRRVLAAIDAIDAALPGQVEFLIHGDHGPRLASNPLVPMVAGDAAAARDRLEPFIAHRIVQPADLSRAPTLQETVQALLLGAAARPQAAARAEP